MILESGGESRECLNQYTQQVTLLSRDLGGGIGEWLRVKECLSQYTQRVTLFRDRE